ncbi:DUF305 domain-containing protein [Umezawaea sp. Da 62-37]|uniref:DUF305 domain-containing protein n=1 Tax=Umezawaea sp. Da 62-37 TaxID=3075927 RepID=UPI0028F73F0A|nr:DUF305 domain-containing protein [Umezawaea sp. Da 62-37]WNV84039.1 DUF305 domain-containing protein [Umezawaea sp. Da 62-37]
MKRHPFAALVAAVLLLAGCGATAEPKGQDDHNAADVMFLQMMLPLHAQGLELTRIAKERTTRAEVRDIAGELDAVQRTETEKMTGWLTGWSQPTAMNGDPSAHEHHGGLHQTSPAEIEALAKAPEADFDTTFLNLMTGHLHNSVELTRSEIEGGSNQQAKDLATTIRESRGKEIARLLSLVGQLPAR